MKTSNKLFVILIAVAFSIALLFAVSEATAQTSKPVDKVLKDTTIKNVKYKLYVGSRGGKYVVRTSKTGNTYKQYIKKSK